MKKHPHICVPVVIALLLVSVQAQAKPRALEAKVLEQVAQAIPFEGASVKLVRGHLAGKLRRNEAFSVELLEPKSWRAPVRARLTTSRGRTLWYTATLEIEVPVLVLTRSVKRGASLVGATRVEKRVLRGLPRDAVHAEPRLEGLVARSDLRAGLVVKRAHGELPIVVRRGQLVSLYVRRGGVTVVDRGISAGAGRVGDTIRVTSSSTQKTLMGVIRAPSTVELP